MRHALTFSPNGTLCVLVSYLENQTWVIRNTEELGWFFIKIWFFFSEEKNVEVVYTCIIVLLCIFYSYCQASKEAGWSTNKPSDLPIILRYGSFSYKLVLTKETHAWSIRGASPPTHFFAQQIFFLNLHTKIELRWSCPPPPHCYGTM